MSSSDPETKLPTIPENSNSLTSNNNNSTGNLPLVDDADSVCIQSRMRLPGVLISTYIIRSDFEREIILGNKWGGTWRMF